MSSYGLRADGGLEEASDAELAVAAGDGGRDAFEELYRRHAPAAMRFALGMTRNADDAADAVAEAFSRVLSILSRRRSEVTNFRAYLLTATRHAAVDISKSARRAHCTSDSDDFAGPISSATPAEHAVAEESRAFMAHAFGDLPDRWQAVLWLTEVESRPPRETARLLGLSANNVSQLAVRARARLRAGYLQAHVGNGVAEVCRFTVDRLGAHVTGTLARRQDAQVTRHMAGCTECQLRVQELENLGPSLGALLPVPVGLASLLARRFFDSATPTLSTPRRRLGRGKHRRSAAGREDVPREGVTERTAGALSEKAATWSPQVSTAASNSNAIRGLAAAPESLGALAQALVNSPAAFGLLAGVGVAAVAIGMVAPTGSSSDRAAASPPAAVAASAGVAGEPVTLAASGGSSPLGAATGGESLPISSVPVGSSSGPIGESVHGGSPPAPPAPTVAAPGVAIPDTPRGPPPPAVSAPVAAAPGAPSVPVPPAVTGPDPVQTPPAPAVNPSTVSGPDPVQTPPAPGVAAPVVAAPGIVPEPPAPALEAPVVAAPDAPPAQAPPSVGAPAIAVPDATQVPSAPAVAIPTTGLPQAPAAPGIAAPEVTTPALP